MSINDATVHHYINVVTVRGGTVFDITESQIAEYQADPDAFVARHVFGLSKAEYVEWIETGGAPLCAGYTKRGTLCRCSTGGSHLDPQEWRARHRQSFCAAHIGADLRALATAPARRRKWNVIQMDRARARARG